MRGNLAFPFIPSADEELCLLTVLLAPGNASPQFNQFSTEVIGQMAVSSRICEVEFCQLLIILFVSRAMQFPGYPQNAATTIKLDIAPSWHTRSLLTLAFERVPNQESDNCNQLCTAYPLCDLRLIA